MHRDIKSLNLGIITLNPPTGVNFDLDDATREETSTNHCTGSLGYLAPEIVALKALDRNDKTGLAQALLPPYGPKADIWGMGLSFYEIYFGADLPNVCMTRKRYLMIRNDVQREAHEETLEKPFHELILGMLAWRAEQRLSAVQGCTEVSAIDTYATKDERAKPSSKRTAGTEARTDLTHSFR